MPNPIRPPGTTPVTAGSSTDVPRYTVKPGDTLGKIAQAAGVSVDALVNLNKGQYPSLATNRNALQVGWSLTMPSGAAAPPNGWTVTQPPEWKPVSNDKVTFVAINNSYEHQSTFESDQMRARGTNVTVLQDSKAGDDKITVNGRTYDLNAPDSRLQFALTLGLPAEQTQKIADAIGAGGNDIKDELAQMAQVFAEAERGGQMPSRLVLSGHHVGYGVYGENNGSLEWPLVKGLTDVMPRAARSVEDLMIAGCFSGGQASMDKYQTMFPNVKTITAYQGISPGASSGATAHQKIWERATRGTSEGVNKAMFDGTRKGENVAVWTKSHGLDDGNPPASLAELRRTMESGRGRYEQVLAGQAEVGDVQTGPTRQFYIAVQRMLQSPELPASEKPALEKLRDQTIRVIFYPVVSKRFAEVYGDRASAAFRSVGLPAPDFKTLSRPDALKAINDFEAKLASTNPQPAAASQFANTLSQFKDLRREVIPDTWV